MNGLSAPFIPPRQQQQQQQQHDPSSPPYDDEEHDGQEQDSPTQGHVQGSWAELGRVPSDGFPITALAFDPIEELLWVGTGNGRLSAMAQPTMHKHVSVLAHPHLTPVRQIRCFGEGVISISGKEVRMHNRNCLAICGAPSKAMLGEEEGGKEGGGKKKRSQPSLRAGGRAAAGSDSDDDDRSSSSGSGSARKRAGKEEFTCGALNVPSSHHMAAYEGECLTVGGNQGHVWQLDLMTGLTVVRTIDVTSATACMESNRAVIAGGTDGRLRFLDGMMRSRQGVERELEAYTGPVTSLCTWDDLVVATGTQGRSLNPYDRSGLAPTRFLPDPLIKVFDLRMLRQTLPLSFAPALGLPSLLSFLPGKDKDRLLVASGSTGQFLTCDPFNVTAAETSFFHLQNHQTGGPSPMSCLATSPSGEFLSFGTPDGLVVTYATEPDAVCNYPTLPLDLVPAFPPPPPTSIPPSDPTPASHYILRPTHLAAPPHPLLELSSSFATTPSVASSLPIRHPPHRVINPALYTKMSVQDFLGYVPNSFYQYPLHSLLFGKARRDAYLVVDPRRKEEEGEDGREDGAGGEGEEDWGDSFVGEEEGQEGGKEEVVAVPGRYRRVVIDFSKRGLDGFDFGKYNRTSLVGLENLLPNSYTNAVLQMMFYVPEVKGLVLGKQYVWGCWGNEKSVVCEMGFLFHMLEMALVEATGGGKKEEGKEGESAPQEQQQQQQQQQREAHLAFIIPPPAPKPCQSSNFLRVFRHVPEVVALGLLEASTAAPVQQRAEGAHRFFLSQIHGEDTAAAAPSPPPPTPASSSSHRRGGRGGAKKAAAAAAAAADKHAAAAAAAAAAAEEDDNEDELGGSEGGGGRKGGSGREKSVIDSLYGYTARTTNTFLHPPNLPPNVTTTRSFILELVYPRTLSRGAGGSPTSSPTLKPTPASPSLPPSSSSASFSLPTDAEFLAKSKTEKILSVLSNINAAATATTAGPPSLPPPLPTFSQVLHSSLCRETRSRGWCEASKGYEPLKQQRVVSSLPSLLALHGGVTVGTGAEVARQIWHQLNPLGGPWLPARVKVKVGAGRKGGREGGVVVLEKVVDPGGGREEEGGREGGEEEELWIGSGDGKTVRMGEELEEEEEKEGEGEEGKEGGREGGGVEKEYELVSIVSFVSASASGGGRGGGRGGMQRRGMKAGGGGGGKGGGGAGGAAVEEGHLLLHVKVPVASNEGGEEGGKEGGKEKKEKWQWYILNDFLVAPTILEDALGFLPTWKEPCILLYRDRATAPAAHAAWLEQLRAAGARLGGEGGKEGGEGGADAAVVTTAPVAVAAAAAAVAAAAAPSIPVSVFSPPPLSTAPPRSLSFTPLPPSQLPGRGDVIGIDAEFVQLEMEKASMREDGTRVVSKEGRQALARLSVLDARNDVVMIDDYVLPSEPVMDYLTRFSGLTREDLDPSLSRHHLVTARTAYLKLRYLIDRGVVLVGHGLKKDFRIINVYVPPAQVVDTVDLWCLKGQRKISLRFLAASLLGENIQGETHDSIEDARTALRLWRKWEEVRREGKVEQVLNGLYEYGRKTGWKLQQSEEQQQQR